MPTDGQSLPFSIFNGQTMANKPEKDSTPQETPDKEANTASAHDAADAAPAEAVDATTDSVSIDVPSPAGPSLLEKYTAHYPEWAKEFARKYFTKTLTQFILHLNKMLLNLDYQFQ